MNRRTLVLGSLLLGSLAWSAWLLVGDDDGGEVVHAVARPAPRADAIHDASAAGGPAAHPAPGGAVAPNAGRGARPLASDAAAAAAGAAPRGGAAARADALARPAAPAHPGNLFAAYTYEPPKPPVVAPPPEPPHAPPLPLAYAGRLVVGAKTTYLLMRGEETIAMAMGDEIEGFRLVEANSKTLVFLHLPTGQRMPLRMIKTS